MGDVGHGGKPEIVQFYIKYLYKPLYLYLEAGFDWYSKGYRPNEAVGVQQ